MREEKQPKFLYKCSKCCDTGWILKDVPHSQPFAIECDCKKKDKVKMNWTKYGINPEMINYKFSNFSIWNKTSQTLKDTATVYFQDFDKIRNTRKNSIMLCGQVGCGKSHLSIALAINFLKKKINVMYMPYRDILTKIKQNMLDTKFYKSQILKYQKCEVLLIDDLFKGKINESDINIMFEIINYRYLNMLPLIISSEYTIENILSFDEAIGSRIYEMCKEYMVEVEKNIRNNYRLK